MTFGAREIHETAAALGFRADSVERVFRLLGLLEAVNSNAFLGPRLALKGGTALNLFFFDIPRLSVDIDLNYVGAADRATMIADRPKVEQSIHAVCARERLTVKRMPSEHAGGKWRLVFKNAEGSSDTLELDLNFLARVPLWPVNLQDSRKLGPIAAKQVAIMDRHELAAGKLAALCSRNASRDLFDARELLRSGEIDRAKLRLAFVVHGGQNRRDWRSVRVEDITADAVELKRQLVPMLRAGFRPRDSEVPSWTAALVRETRELMSAVLPLEANELEFLQCLNGAGEIVPEHLTSDPSMQSVLRDHPGLMWKALNVRKRQGAVDEDIP